jgi:hypothetical protein
VNDPAMFNRIIVEKVFDELAIYQNQERFIVI